ncbi:MAG: glycosyltransferase [Oceanospirillales bacterium]|nr:glycosyltransferase [Oceanospirillales bacterium]
MMVTEPLVSVLLPTYNSERYIRQALDSVLSQSYLNIELVISDDASSDRTPKILAEYQSRYPDVIKLFLQEKNLGVTRNCNFILQRCRGDHIVFFAGDDLLYENCVSDLVTAIEDGGHAMVFHRHDFIDKYSEKMEQRGKHYPSHVGDIARLIKAGVYVKCNGMMARASCLPEEGYDESLRYSSDFDFVFRILGRYNSYIYVGEALSAYRKHKESLTVKNRNVCLMDTSEVYLRLMKQHPRYSFYISRLVSNSFRSSRFSRVGGYDYEDWLVAAIGVFPFNVAAWGALIIYYGSLARVRL